MALSMIRYPPLVFAVRLINKASRLFFLCVVTGSSILIPRLFISTSDTMKDDSLNEHFSKNFCKTMSSIQSLFQERQIECEKNSVRQ